MQHLPGLSFLSKNYRGILLDQFGVLHDGRRPYPGSVAALKRLHELRVPVYLLSNSSQRSRVAYGRLESMGFCKEWITDIVTSGELTHLHLLQRPGPFWQELGRRCLHFTWNSRGKIQLEELDLEVVTKVDQADFVLTHGTDALGLPDGTVPRSYVELTTMLQRVAERSVPPPMIVANPDLVTVDGGELKTMPGSFGMIYQEMGGEVIWMGKPGKLIYEYMMQRCDCRPSELIAIGDSFEHDIKGASQMGIDSVFVCAGIHASEIFFNGQISPRALEKLCAKHGVVPTFYIDVFNNEKL